jgi:hypothetical protein
MAVHATLTEALTFSDGGGLLKLNISAKAT